MNKILNFMILIVICLLGSCVASKSTLKITMLGDYYSESEAGNDLLLQIKKKSFVVINKVDSYNFCCDTITCGSWSIDDSLQFLVFSNTKSFFDYDAVYYDNYSISRVNVIEKREKRDSLMFIITNSIEKSYKKFNKDRGIDYEIAVFDKFNYSLVKGSDTIVMKKISPVRKFDLATIIRGDADISNIEYTQILSDYQVKDTTANVFYIDLLDVNYKNIATIRLKDDYVKIINKNTLLWNGEYYHKKNH